MRHFIFGKNVINNLIHFQSHLIKKLFLSQGQLEANRATFEKFPLEIWTEEQFDRRFPKEKHQRIAAEITGFATYSFNNLLKKIALGTENELILILDRIQDPQNFGSIIRSANACGVLAIIIPKTKQAPINATLAKASSGTLFNSKIVLVSNLHDAIIKLKKANFWIVSTTANGQDAYDKLNLGQQNVALILGNEGDGVSPLLIKKSDYTTYIPMINTESLNVNAAAAILLYEIRKQQNFWKKS